MNLKVPGAILPLGCAILSTRAITVRGGWYNPPLGELGLKAEYTDLLYTVVYCHIIVYVYKLQKGFPLTYNLNLPFMFQKATNKCWI